MKYIVYNSDVILRIVDCPSSQCLLQTGYGEYVMKGEANDATQKVEFDGLDDEGQPINPRVVDKTPEEIERDNPKREPKPFEKQQANITNKQLQSLLRRIENLETPHNIS